MTPQLLDRPIASGSTLFRPPRRSAVQQEARDFYQHGLREPPGRYVKIHAGDEWGDPLARYLEEQFNELLRLRPGWDGGRAREVTVDAVGAALRLLFSLNLGGLPPQIFPLVDGGVQMEWHAARRSLAIEVDAAGDCHGLAVDEHGAEIFNDAIAIEPRPEVDNVDAILRAIISRVLGLYTTA